VRWRATASSWSPTMPTSSPSTASRGPALGDRDGRLAQNYGATSGAPGGGDLVITGTSGGDEGVRGFLAAFDRATGKEAWRFWTVAQARRAGVGSWKGRDIDHPGTTAGSPALRYRARHPLLATGNPVRTTRATSAWATTCIQTRSWPSTPERESSSGISSSLPRRLGLGCRAAGPCSWTRTGRGSPGSSCSTPTATLLLRAGPDEWRAAAGQAVHQEADLGEGDRSGRSPGPEPDQTPTLAGTRVCPSVEGATNWFPRPSIPPPASTTCRPREVQRLHQGPHGVEGRP